MLDAHLPVPAHVCVLRQMVESEKRCCIQGYHCYQLMCIHNHELVAAHGSYTPMFCWASCTRGSVVKW